MKNQEGPLVSICCNAFNHEEYIADALDGFLRQKTTFPIEILVHDDASSDKTANIIKSYEHKFPGLIKPVCQSKNQYSQGKNITYLNVSRAKGAYIALCEGDDYWTCDSKLQTQIDLMESNNDITMCFHAATELDCSSNVERVVCQHLNHDAYISAEEIIVGRGGYIPTASIVMRKDCFDSYHSHMLSSTRLPIGDFFIQSFAACSGKVFFYSKAMCLYRRNALGSWTSRQGKQSNRLRYALDMLVPINEIDKAFGYRYTDSFSEVFVHYSISALSNLTPVQVFLNRLVFVYSKARSFRVFLYILQQMFVRRVIRLFSRLRTA